MLAWGTERAMFGKPSLRGAVVVGALSLALAAASLNGYAAHTGVSDSGQAPRVYLSPTPAPAAAPTPPLPPDAAPAPEFAAISKLINDAIAARRMPGAVVVIGHGGEVVFRQAYGLRK